MDAMILGETLAHTGGGSKTTYRGFWVPSRGSKGVGAIETFWVSAASVFTVKVETKTSDEADPTTPTYIGTQAVNSTTPDVFRFDLDDAEDLVRYVVECTSESDEHIHFQLCQPLWAPN